LDLLVFCTLKILKMSDILSLLNSTLGGEMIRGVARETGQPEDKTADVLQMAMPLLMGAMKKNASTPQGAEGLLNALSSRHDGSILDNLGGLFGGGVDQSVLNEGAGILGHVLGGRQPVVENALSQKSGIDASSIANILKIAAPIVMGYLGRQQSQANIKDAGGMDALLGGLLGGQQSQGMDMFSALLDSDGDGSIIDDVSDMVQGKKGGLGGLLGGLFGK
jgi:hypothetical protein